MNRKIAAITLGAAVAALPIAISPTVAQARGNSPGKTTICHYDEDLGTWTPISVSTKSVAKHLQNHNDGTIGGAVPGVDGYSFDDTCTPRSDGD